MQFYVPNAHIEPYEHTPLPPDHQQILSITDYIKARQEHSRTTDSTVDALEKAHWLRSSTEGGSWPIPRPAEKDWKKLIDTSPGYSCYRQRAGKSGHRPFGTYSHLRYVPFDVFRRLGFALWSTERLSGYGLMPSQYPQCDYQWYRSQKYDFTWQSVLSPEGIADMERGERAMGRLETIFKSIE